MTQMVSGANQLAHFNVRCPACNKLYRVDSKEIHSASPHFDCNACKVRFCFDFPPRNVNRIETRVISMKDTFQIEDGLDQSEIPELKTCPKCEARNPRLTKECIKCGIIFEKVEMLTQEDATLGAIPSLVKTWQDLLSDYDNIKKHIAFVDRCEELQALPYALKKYQTLKEAQPQDKVVQEMLPKVLLRNLRKKSESISFLKNAMDSGEKAMEAVNSRVNWLRIQKVAPIIMGLILALIGLSNPSARNMIGFGVALIFLTLGLRVFLKGRLSLEDFW